MELVHETDVREFLLGTADEGCAARVEDWLLNGTIGEAQVSLIEDELIDDFVFDNLSAKEKEAFEAHFLCTDDRAQRLALGRQLISRAQNYSVASNKPSEADKTSKTRPKQFSWRLTAVAGLAASVLLAVLLGFEVARLHLETRAARRAETEANALKSALAVSNGRSASLPDHEGPGDLQPDLDLTQGSVRGIHNVQPTPTIHISSRRRLIWIRIRFPSPIQGAYREEIIGDSGKTLWKQEINVQSKQHSLEQSEFAVPANLLPPGDYLVRFEAFSGDNFRESYPFRVGQN